jgi:hypothetical protein
MEGELMPRMDDEGRAKARRKDTADGERECKGAKDGKRD